MGAMPASQRQRGFTLFELVVVAALVALLAAVAFERFRFYQEAAEAEAAQGSLAMLKTALYIRSAELISANRWQELQRLPKQNPFELLEEKPSNYGGLWLGSGASGQWYFDGAAKALVYRPARTDGFSAADGGKEMRFAVVGRNSSGQIVSGEGAAYVSLRPAAAYSWLGHTVR